eukprot:Sspe_Gene.49887::Locus_27282_Transcript_1_1_Confidence_1.000_Length_4678::g.49887::m.49887
MVLLPSDDVSEPTRSCGATASFLGTGPRPPPPSFGNGVVAVRTPPNPPFKQVNVALARRKPAAPRQTGRPHVPRSPAPTLLPTPPPGDPDPDPDTPPDTTPPLCIGGASMREATFALGSGPSAAQLLQGSFSLNASPSTTTLFEADPIEVLYADIVWERKALEMGGATAAGAMPRILGRVREALQLHGAGREVLDTLGIFERALRDMPREGRACDTAAENRAARDLERLQLRARKELALLQATYNTRLGFMQSRVDRLEGECSALRGELAEKDARWEKQSTDHETLIRDMTFHRRRLEREIESMCGELEAARSLCKSTEYHAVSLQAALDSRTQALNDLLNTNAELKEKNETLEEDLARLREKYEALQASTSATIASLRSQLAQSQADVGTPTHIPEMREVSQVVWGEVGTDVLDLSLKDPVCRRAITCAAKYLARLKSDLRRADDYLAALDKQKDEVASFSYTPEQVAPPGTTLDPLGTATTVPPPLRRTDLCPCHSLGRQQLHTFLAGLYSFQSQAVGNGMRLAQSHDYITRLIEQYLEKCYSCDYRQEMLYSVMDACSRFSRDPIVRVFLAMLGRQVGAWLSTSIEVELDHVRGAISSHLAPHARSTSVVASRDAWLKIVESQFHDRTPREIAALKYLGGRTAVEPTARDKEAPLQLLKVAWRSRGSFFCSG